MAHGMELAKLDRDVEATADDGAEVIVGFGGGTALDTAKYLAWKRGLPLVQIPTITSVDAGFTDAIGVRADGHVRYVGTIEPEEVVLDIDLIRSAPGAPQPCRHRRRVVVSHRPARLAGGGRGRRRRGVGRRSCRARRVAPVGTRGRAGRHRRGDAGRDPLPRRRLPARRRRVRSARPQPVRGGVGALLGVRVRARDRRSSRAR